MATKATIKLQPTSESPEISQSLRDRAMRVTRTVVPFTDIDLEASTRNQARFLAIHPETVELYTAGMNDGAVFPPIVVFGSKPPYTVGDGNHRLRSAIAAGFTSAEMLIVNVATSAQRELFIYQANAKHGLPTSLDERLAQGVYLVGLGNQAVDVAAILSVPERKLWDAVASKRTRQRLERLGARIGKNWSEAFIRRLGSIRSDVIIVPTAKLIFETRMSTADAEALITKLNSHSTEGESLDFLTEQSKHLAPVIASTAGGTLELPKEISTLRIGLRMFVSMDPDKLAVAIGQIDPALRESLARDTVEGVSKLISLAGAFKK